MSQRCTQSGEPSRAVNSTNSKITTYSYAIRPSPSSPPATPLDVICRVIILVQPCMDFQPAVYSRAGPTRTEWTQLSDQSLVCLPSIQAFELRRVALVQACDPLQSDTSNIFLFL